MPTRSKILLLSAYNTPSHNSWCNGLIENFPEYNWEYLQLTPRFFSWRIRGNPLSFIHTNEEKLNQDYDLIIATSMVDLATICGLFPNLARCRKIVYFHENQFAYPQPPNTPMRLEPLMVNLYSALAADQVLFNTEFNRQSFFSGVFAFLKKMPDHTPVNFIESTQEKCQVLPVPLQSITPKPQIEKIPNSIIWNHRWEYDKNPEQFFAALSLLKNRNLNFKLIVMGQQFRSTPDIFTKAKEEFAEIILCWGEQTREDYKSWLAKGEFVISTAIHEFQGLAVMEAVQHGAIPIIPNRLSYPEIFPSEFLYTGDEVQIANHIEQLFAAKQKPVAPDMDRYTWDTLRGEYLQLIKK